MTTMIVTPAEAAEAAVVVVVEEEVNNTIRRSSMCLNEETCKLKDKQKTTKKHYEQFGKWKHGLQRHFLGKKKKT